MAIEPDPNAENKDASAAPVGSTVPASAAAGAAAPVGAPVKPPAPRKKWNPQAPAPASPWLWRIVFGGAFMAMVLLGVIVLMMVNTKIESGPPKLGEEFREPTNNYAIHPPVNWWMEDPHDGVNFYIKGPREHGYTPLIMICVDVAPGHLDSYMKEYKGRLQGEDTSLKIESETRDKIDHSDTARLVYTWSMQDADKKTVEVKTVQFIVEDVPRFYRITCSVRADLFEQYLPRFETSARTFRVLPLSSPQYKVVPPSPGF